MTLKAYMIFSRGAGPQEGAALVFSRTAREAKRRAFPVLRDWFDSGWTDVGSRWIRNDAEWLAKQEGIDMEGETRVIDSPRYCERCELWGTGPLDAEGICETCRDDEEIEEALS